MSQRPSVLLKQLYELQVALGGDGKVDDFIIADFVRVRDSVEEFLKDYLTSSTTSTSHVPPVTQVVSRSREWISRALSNTQGVFRLLTEVLRFLDHERQRKLHEELYLERKTKKNKNAEAKKEDKKKEDEESAEEKEQDSPST